MPTYLAAMLATAVPGDLNEAYDSPADLAGLLIWLSGETRSVGKPATTSKTRRLAIHRGQVGQKYVRLTPFWHPGCTSAGTERPPEMVVSLDLVRSRWILHGTRPCYCFNVRLEP